MKLLHKEAQMASWECRALAQACRLMFNKFNDEFLDIGKPGTRSRSGRVFKIDRPITKKFITTTSNRFRNQWNNFPPHIRIIDDQDHLNMVIKRFFRCQYLGE